MSELEQLPGEETQRKDFVGYAIAILAVGVAALVCWGVRLLVIADVLSVITVAVFSAAALLTAWIAGIGPGFVATASGAAVLWFLASGPRHALALLPPRETAVIIASTALSALITTVVGPLRAGHAALLRGLPDIERRARDRAKVAASRMIEEERRTAAAAQEEVAVMQRRLQEWSSAASKAMAARARYLAGASLAVGTAVRSIQRYAARLGMPGRGTLTSLQQRDVDGIAMCEEHVTRLLDTVLAPARVESGLLVPKNADVSLSEVVAQAIALVEPLLAAHGTTVECGKLHVSHVRADAPILTQVLARLILDQAQVDRRVFRLEAQETGEGVTLECHGSSDESQATAPPEAEGEREPGDEVVVWSSLAGTEQVGRMGGKVTTGTVPGSGSLFSIWLSTRPAPPFQTGSETVALWPPIAFELPRGGSASR